MVGKGEMAEVEDRYPKKKKNGVVGQTATYWRWWVKMRVVAEQKRV